MITNNIFWLIIYYISNVILIIYFYYYLFAFMINMWQVEYRCKRYGWLAASIIFPITGAVLFYFIEYQPFLKGEITMNELSSKNLWEEKK